MGLNEYTLHMAIHAVLVIVCLWLFYSASYLSGQYENLVRLYRELLSCYQRKVEQVTMMEEREANRIRQENKAKHDPWQAWGESKDD